MMLNAGDKVHVTQNAYENSDIFEGEDGLGRPAGDAGSRMSSGFEDKQH